MPIDLVRHLADDLCIPADWNSWLFPPSQPLPWGRDGVRSAQRSLPPRSIDRVPTIYKGHSLRNMIDRRPDRIDSVSAEIMCL